MPALRIALLQALPAGSDPDANLAKGEELCRRAHELGADIALFPEMWSIGYRFFDRAKAGAHEEWAARATPSDGPFVAHFRALARELDMAIALTYLEESAGGTLAPQSDRGARPRNTVSLIDRRGEIVLNYSKVHTCEFDVESACAPGDGFRTCILSTRAGDVRVGAMICYDREFPESARILMLQGAEVILTPNACGLERHRLGQFRARAYENMVALAMANYPAPQCNGHSIAVDPICFDAQGVSRDTTVLEAGEEEGVFVAEFDLDAIRAYRQNEVWGNAYRRPRLYGALTAAEVQQPFLRADATR